MRAYRPKDDAHREGLEQFIGAAKRAAEAGHRELGPRDVSTMIECPNGEILRLRPRERGTGVI